MTEERGHSPIGASGYHRWKACPGSVRLCKSLPNVASVYAAQGTCAHFVAAECLTKAGVEPHHFLGFTKKFDGHEITVDQEMVDAVRDYISAIRRDTGPDDVLMVEVGFDLSALYPELWGTADCVIYKPAARKLIVRDFKYGAGIAVEVEDNEQLMYYALGALTGAGTRLNGLPVEVVELVINQPRLDHEDGTERRWPFPVVDLIDFRAQLVEDAKRTAAPDAPLVTGDHCRFCPAKGACPKLRDEAMAKAKTEFSLVPLAPIRAQDLLPYDPGKLAEALVWAERVEAWARGVREFAYNEAMRGYAPPGFKLVAKRAQRKWRSEQETEQVLTVLGLKDEDIYEPRTVKSPTQIEKLTGKKKFAAEIAPYVVKESSGLTLVPQSDERPAISRDAASEFTPVSGTTLAPAITGTKQKDIYD